MKKTRVDMVWTGATKTFPGVGKRRKGDAFSLASRDEAKAFRALGWAIDAPAQAAAVPATPAAPPPAQEPSPTIVASNARVPMARRIASRNLVAGSEDKPAARRTYQRRDMKAEE